MHISLWYWMITSSMIFVVIPVCSSINLLHLERSVIRPAVLGLFRQYHVFFSMNLFVSKHFFVKNAKNWWSEIFDMWVVWLPTKYFCNCVHFCHCYIKWLMRLSLCIDLSMRDNLIYVELSITRRDRLRIRLLFRTNLS